MHIGYETTTAYGHHSVDSSEVGTENISFRFQIPAGFSEAAGPLALAGGHCEASLEPGGQPGERPREDLGDLEGLGGLPGDGELPVHGAAGTDTGDAHLHHRPAG